MKLISRGLLLGLLALPFFFLATPAHADGVVVAIGDGGGHRHYHHHHHRHYHR